MLSEAKHFARHATPSMGNQMLRFTQHDISGASSSLLYRTCQTCTELSALAEAISLPSGDQATEKMTSFCP